MYPLTVRLFLAWNVFLSIHHPHSMLWSKCNILSTTLLLLLRHWYIYFMWMVAFGGTTHTFYTSYRFLMWGSVRWLKPLFPVTSTERTGLDPRSLCVGPKLWTSLALRQDVYTCLSLSDSFHWCSILTFKRTYERWGLKDWEGKLRIEISGGE
jgi:hypothetical protein